VALLTIACKISGKGVFFLCSNSAACKEYSRKRSISDERVRLFFADDLAYVADSTASGVLQQYLSMVEAAAVVGVTNFLRGMLGVSGDGLSSALVGVDLFEVLLAKLAPEVRLVRE
jgi:hypothetical protein